MGECTALFIEKDTVRICILKRLTDHSVCALFIGMIESSELEIDVVLPRFIIVQTAHMNSGIA